MCYNQEHLLFLLSIWINQVSSKQGNCFEFNLEVYLLFHPFNANLNEMALLLESFDLRTFLTGNFATFMNLYKNFFVCSVFVLFFFRLVLIYFNLTNMCLFLLFSILFKLISKTLNTSSQNN